MINKELDIHEDIELPLGIYFDDLYYEIEYPFGAEDQFEIEKMSAQKKPAVNFTVVCKEKFDTQNGPITAFGGAWVGDGSVGFWAIMADHKLLKLATFSDLSPVISVIMSASEAKFITDSSISFVCPINRVCAFSETLRR